MPVASPDEMGQDHDALARRLAAIAGYRHFFRAALGSDGITPARIGAAVRSCVTPISAAAGKKVVTIEGVQRARVGRAVQEAWRRLDVVQCGYCQPGQIMQAVALLKSKPHPTDSDIDDAMSGNICRCGTYHRIIAAIERAAKEG